MAERRLPGLADPVQNIIIKIRFVNKLIEINYYQLTELNMNKSLVSLRSSVHQNLLRHLAKL